MLKNKASYSLFLIVNKIFDILFYFFSFLYFSYKTYKAYDIENINVRIIKNTFKNNIKIDINSNIKDFSLFFMFTKNAIHIIKSIMQRIKVITPIGLLLFNVKLIMLFWLPLEKDVLVDVELLELKGCLKKLGIKHIIIKKEFNSNPSNVIINDIAFLIFNSVKSKLICSFSSIK